MRQCWGSSRMPAPCRRAPGQSLGPGFAADPCPPGPPLTTALAEVGRRKTSGGLGGRLRGIPVADGRGGGTGAGPTRWRTRIRCSRPPIFLSVGAVPRRSPRSPQDREEVSDLSERAVVVTARGALGGAGGGPGRQHDGDAAARGARDEGAPPHRAPHPRALSRPVPPPPRPPGRAGVGARGFRRHVNRGTTSWAWPGLPLPAGARPRRPPPRRNATGRPGHPIPPNAAETERSSPRSSSAPGGLGLTRSPPSAASRCWTCR